MNRYVYFFGIVIAAFLALGMFQAKTGASQSVDDIQRLKRDIARLDEEIAVLEQEYDALAAQDRIARLAAEKLQMGPARSWQMLEPGTAKDRFGPLVEYQEEAADE